MKTSYYPYKVPSNTHFGDYCVIGPDVKIGKNCFIGNRVTIVGNVEIGDNNIIVDGTCIGYEPQHLLYYKEDRKQGINSKIVIGNDNIIRENCTIHQPYSGTVTSIGDNNFFMVNTHIAHNCIIGNNTIIANNVALGGHCKVRSYANIGLNTCIHQYTRIGEYSMIGMGSVVTKDVLPFHLVAGTRDDMKVAINVIGYSRNYKGHIKLAHIKHLRMENYPTYDVNDDMCPELHKLMAEFRENTKNGIYY